MTHEKTMPPIYQSIEDAVNDWVDRIGRDVLVVAIEDGRTTIQQLSLCFGEALHDRLSVSGEDEPDCTE